MYPHGHRQRWRPRTEAWKESVPRGLQRAQGSSACQPWGSQKGNQGRAYVFLWNIKDSIRDFCCAGKGSGTPLVSRQEEKRGRHAQSCCGGFASPVESRVVADPAGGSQHGHPGHRDGDDHLHLRSQNAELSSKPPWGWARASGAEPACSWAEHLWNWPRGGWAGQEEEEAAAEGLRVGRPFLCLPLHP